MSFAPEQKSSAPNGAITDFDAVVVGAGFGGLRMLYELRQLGMTVKVIEAGSDVGGTWYWNRYPGARTDSESWVYCFGFSRELEQEWDWKERYPAQREVLAYFEHVADRFDLRRDMQFDTRVESARYDQTTNRWILLTDGGQSLTCKFFIPATGPLSRPLDPPFEGLDSFQGETYLTARWPEKEVDFSGKRVGVIGTGATGVQVVPLVAEEAAQVTVFQRTPNYVIPGRNRQLSDAEREAIKASYDEIWARTRHHVNGFAMPRPNRKRRDVTPAEQQQILQRAWDMGGFQFLFDTFEDLMTDEETNQMVADFLRHQIRAMVDDPVTAELLCPKGYPLGAKRPPLGHHYYEAFNRDNVALVDVSTNPIERITNKGLRTGTDEHEVDILIFATGFDASTGALMAMDIRGRDDQSLNERWADGPRTYLGIGVDEFPNMFMISGPQSPFANIPVIIEHTVRWISRALSHIRDNELATFEPTPESIERWVTEVDGIVRASLVGRGESEHSWFLGANVPGKPRAPLFFFGGANVYFDRLEEVADGDFEGFSARAKAPGPPDDLVRSRPAEEDRTWSTA